MKELKVKKSWIPKGIRTWCSLWGSCFLPIVLVCLAVIAFGWGWYCSAIAPSLKGVPFSRAGAFVAMLLSVFSVWPVAQVLSRKENLVRQTMRNLMSNSNISAQVAEIQLDRVGDKAKQNSKKVMKFVNWAEAILIFLGAVVWGFGDLIFVGWGECGRSICFGIVKRLINLGV